MTNTESEVTLNLDHTPQSINHTNGTYNYWRDAEASVQNDAMAAVYFQKVYPRKYAAPGGWGSPKHAALSLAAHTASAVRRRDAGASVLREGWATLLLCRLVENNVPTYWVGSDLAEALWHTKFPAEFKLESVKLPHSGMLFMLPKSLPFNSGKEHGFMEWLGFCTTISEADDKTIGRHGFICPMGNSFGGISGGAGYMDETMSDWTSAVSAEIHKQDTSSAREASQTEERSAELHSIIKFTANLLLYMADRGVDAIVADSSSAPAGTAKLHTAHEPNKTGLWQPKWIGKNYRKKTEWQGGTHASPRLHRRDGHWRQQPYGPGRQEIKRIWIDTMWVNAA